MGKAILTITTLLFLYSCASTEQEQKSTEISNTKEDLTNIEILPIEITDSTIFTIDESHFSLSINDNLNSKKYVFEIEESKILSKVIITTVDLENNTIVFSNSNQLTDSLFILSKDFSIKYETEYQLKTYQNSYLNELRDYNNIWIKGIIDSNENSNLEFHFDNISGQIKLTIIKNNS